MTAVRLGVVLALLVAGPQLWGLVAAGDLESSTALVRWGTVAAACALGAAAIRRIVTDYEAQAARAAAVAAVAARHDTAPDGSRIVHEGTPLQAGAPAAGPDGAAGTETTGE